MTVPKPRPRSADRAREMLAAYRAGQSYAQIGAAHGLSRQRVHRIVAQVMRVRPRNAAAEMESADANPR